MGQPQRFRVQIDEREHDVLVFDDGTAEVEGERYELVEVVPGATIVRMSGASTQHTVALDDTSRPSHGCVRGIAARISVKTARDAAFEAALRGAGKRASAGSTLHAPMPGRVTKVLVTDGDIVERDRPILIIEAMKMENELHAPCDGRVERLSVREGDTVEAGQSLVRIAPQGDTG